MRFIEDQGWLAGGIVVHIVMYLGGLVKDHSGLEARYRLRYSVATLAVTGLQLVAALVGTALPVVEGLLNEYLPTVAQPFCHALLVAAPRTGLACFLRAYTALTIFCEIVLWLTSVMIVVGLVAVETAVYLTTIAFLATTWAFVYRDLVHLFGMRMSPSYRAGQRARDMQLTVHQFFDLESRSNSLQGRLDNVFPELTQQVLEIMFPLAALDFFDTAGRADLAQAGVAFSSYLEEVIDPGERADMAAVFRGLANLLVAEAQAAQPTLLALPHAHFLRTSRRTASALVAHLLSCFNPHNADEKPPFSVRLFLPLLLTYPGFLAFEYLYRRQPLPPPNPVAFDNDNDTSNPHLAAVRKACIVMHVNALDFDINAQQLEQLMPTYINLRRTRRKAVAAEVAAFRAILDAVLDWKNRKNELEMRRFKQD